MKSKAIQILLVEDNPADARLFRESLAESSLESFALIHVTRLAQALKRLTDGAADLVLLDLGLPDAHGLEAVRRVHAAAPELPLVVLTGLDDEETAVRSLQEGAQDYLPKGKLDGGSLRRAIRYAIERQRMQTTLRSLALFDELTGLYNRRGFLTLAEHNLKLARRSKRDFALVFIDLDGLKQINDSLGHEWGDETIAETARVLKDSYRQSDILGRLGGDEFAVFMAGGGGDAADVAKKRLKGKLHALSLEPGRRFRLSLSVGILRCRFDETRPLEDLLAEADALMYQEKKSKRAARAASPEAIATTLGDSPTKGI